MAYDNYAVSLNLDNMPPEPKGSSKGSNEFIRKHFFHSIKNLNFSNLFIFLKIIIVRHENDTNTRPDNNDNNWARIKLHSILRRKVLYKRIPIFRWLPMSVF